MLCGVIPVSMFNPQQQTADERMTDVTSIPVSICDDADALLVEIESPPRQWWAIDWWSCETTT
jgi:hypothetical protein